MKRRVVIETPYAGDVEANVAYARECMRDSLAHHGESPFLSHLLYTQVLDDGDPHERTGGINAGLAWACVADATVVYTDLGITPGMALGIEHAERCMRPVEYRCLAHRAWSEGDHHA